MRKALAIGLVLTFAASSAMAQAPATATSQPKGAVNDNLFVMAAAAAGMAEVTTAKLAVERAGCAEVKQFAQKMLDDHTKANRELMAMAAAKGLSVPTTLQYTDQAEGQSLAGLSGEDFDNCYTKGQHAAHICAVGLFTGESERGRDPEIKAWAAKTLPTLKAHKHMVKELCEAHEAKEKKENPSAH